MVKKKNIENIYETDQANKKHRKKNKKLLKREKYKKDKKKIKKTRHEKRKLLKYITLSFKENQKDLDLPRLPLDLDEIVKQVTKLINLSESSVKEVPELFRLLEEEKKEINLSGLEDISAQKYICKLFKNFKLFQNPKNPFKFKIRDYNIDLKARSTTEVDYIIRQCISSFYLFIKAIFEYQNFLIKKAEKKEGSSKNSDDEISENENSDKEENSEVGDDSEQSESSGEMDNDPNEKKRELDKIKDEIDYENMLIEEKFGGNAELMNRAFHKIMNDEQLFTNKNEISKTIIKSEKNISSSTNNLEDLTNTNTNQETEKNKKIIGPTIPDFLAATLKLISNNDEEITITENERKNQRNSKNQLDDLLNNFTYQKNRNNIYEKKNKNFLTINSTKIEPINKESYHRILAEERNSKLTMDKELEDYESKYRGTSLLELHQEKLAKEKGKNSNSFSANRGFDREKVMGVGRVDSKRALGIMQDKNGLKGRFEQKEKYIGY